MRKAGFLFDVLDKLTLCSWSDSDVGRSAIPGTVNHFSMFFTFLDYSS